MLKPSQLEGRWIVSAPCPATSVLPVFRVEVLEPSLLPVDPDAEAILDAHPATIAISCFIGIEVAMVAFALIMPPALYVNVDGHSGNEISIV